MNSCLKCRVADRLRRKTKSVARYYWQWHVNTWCRPDGCDCPCGYCYFDPRHVPGGSEGQR